MGKKAIYIVISTGTFACLIQLVACLLPQHRLGITRLPHATVLLILKTTYTHVTVTGSTGAVEREAGSKKGVKRSWWSTKNLHGQHTLEDLRLHFCVEALNLLWPGLCHGLDSAYMVGITALICLVANFICQVVGCYLLYDYCTRKKNPKYREMSASLILGGAVVLLAVNLAYYFVVLTNLSHMQGGVSNIIFSSSSASGPSIGYIMMCVGLAIQLIQGSLLLVFTTDAYGEEMYLDQKEAREGEFEMGTMNFGCSSQTMPWGMEQQPVVIMDQQPVMMMDQQPVMMMQQQPMVIMNQSQDMPMGMGGGAPAW